jgi:peptidoglycan lytic transglycosylase
MMNKNPVLQNIRKYLSTPQVATYKLIVALVFISLAGCSTTAPHGSLKQNTSSAASTSSGGGYYLDDGPDNNPPSNLDLIPDAIPKSEPLRKANMRPYVALGNSYKPMTSLAPYKKRGIASWYGRRYHGNLTASGEAYDMYAMTAAHPTLPLPSYARVTNVQNGQSVVVRINDRGPFLANRLIDLSYTAAYKLGILTHGRGEVEVESILPGTEMAQLAQQNKPEPIQTIPSITNNNVDINGVYLQLGAFGVADNAHNFLFHIQKELPWLSHTIGISETNGLFKIKAGPYPNQILAQQAADSIIQQLAITPMLLID